MMFSKTTIVQGVMKMGIKSFIFEDLDANSSTINLYHFACNKNEKLLLDPKRFGENHYSKREKNTSNVPRVFFYTKPEQKESFFDSAHCMYFVTVPKSKIYNLKQDPSELKKIFSTSIGRVDFDAILKFLIKEQQYDGVLYDVGAFEVVAWFNPIMVQKVEE
jgi:hypothetical protein